MVAFCPEHDITLLTYGTLCGGLLRSVPRATRARSAALTTASLQKYKQMIDAWGGWALFQELLQVLRQIADQYGVSLANVAVRYILDRPTVAGVIVGVRLGVTDHPTDNARVFEFSLTPGIMSASGGPRQVARSVPPHRRLRRRISPLRGRLYAHLVYGPRLSHHSVGGAPSGATLSVINAPEH